MKRCFLVILSFLIVFSFSVSAFAGSDAADLGMDMNTFMQKYNAIGSSLSSSLVKLEKPYKWTTYNNYSVAWLKPDNKSGVTILLLSSESSIVRDTSYGLDMIQIFMDNDSDFLSLITVTSRCVQVLSDPFFGYSMAPFYVSDLISYYYENVYASGGSAYRTIDTEEKYILTLFKSSNQYYFSISLRGE